MTHTNSKFLTFLKEKHPHLVRLYTDPPQSLELNQLLSRMLSKQVKSLENGRCRRLEHSITLHISKVCTLAQTVHHILRHDDELLRGCRIYHTAFTPMACTCGFLGRYGVAQWDANNPPSGLRYCFIHNFEGQREHVYAPWDREIVWPDEQVDYPTNQPRQEVNDAQDDKAAL